MERKRYDEIAAMLERPNHHSQEEFRKAVEELSAEAPGAIAEQSRRLLEPQREPGIAREAAQRKEALAEAAALLSSAPAAAQAKLRLLLRNMESDVVVTARGPQGFGYGEWTAELRRLLSVVKPSSARLTREQA